MRNNALTPAERQIVELLVVNCLSVKQVAKQLDRSSGTISRHKHMIYTKLKVKSIAELAKWYWTVDQFKRDLSWT